MKYKSLILSVLLLGTTAAWADRFTPHSAEYELYRGSSTLGSGTVKLEAAEQADCYVYSYVAKPSWMLRWVTGNISERSEFCVNDGRLQPNTYHYHRSGVGSDDENYSLSFDLEAGTVTDDKGNSREYPAGAVDRLMIQLEAQRLTEGLSIPAPELRLGVTMVEDDRIKQYQLAIVGNETIKTPAGEFETIRVERTNDKKKSTRFWVAPSLGNKLIKVEQQKGENKPIGIVLKKLPRYPEQSKK